MSLKQAASVGWNLARWIQTAVLGALISASHIQAAPSGVVVAWGENYSGQCDVPPDLTNVVAVAAGRFHSLALKSDGTVVGWGGVPKGSSQLLAGLSNVVGIAAGWNNSAALKNDGTMVVWGNLEPPAGWTGVKAIASGSYGGLALLSNGTVRAWGAGGSGFEVPPGLSNIVAVGAAVYHFLAVKSDGTVVTQPGFDPPPGLSNVVAVTGGNYHSTALKADGTVVGWGSDIAFGEAVGQATPPPDLQNVCAIAGGDYHNLALQSNGVLVAWGWDGYGVRTIPEGLSGVIGMAANFHNLVITTKPFLTAQPQPAWVHVGQTATFAPRAVGSPPLSFQWRFKGVDLAGETNSTLVMANVTTDNAGDYQLMITNPGGTTESLPVRLELLSAPDVLVEPNPALALAGTDVQFHARCGGMPPLRLQWRFNGVDLADATNEFLLLGNVRLDQAGVYDVLVYNDYGMADSADATLSVLSVNQVEVWGYGLGVGSVLPPAWSEVVKLAGGWQQWLMLRRDGTVVDWSGVSNVVAMAAGAGFDLALQSNGTLAKRGEAWQTDISPPVWLTNVVGVAAGETHALAVRKDGSVVVWGAQTNVPGGLSGVAAVEAGRNYSLALKTNGTITAWGDNSQGQCDVPVGLSDVAAMAAGYQHCLALRSNGTVVAWGGNAYGQTNVPAGLSNVVAVAAGYGHSLALQAEGTLVAWGNNDRGQSTIPVGVRGVIAIAAIKADRGTIVALDLPTIVTPPQSATAFANDTLAFSVMASGTEPLSYQWQFQGTDIPDATNTVLTLTDVQMAQQGLYLVVARNRFGLPATATAYLTVIPRDPPSDVRLEAQWSVYEPFGYWILVNRAAPAEAELLAGQEIRFTATAVSPVAVSFEWYRDTVQLPLSGLMAFSITDAQAADVGTYRVVATNIFGATTSAPIVLRVHYPAAISVQPQNQGALGRQWSDL